VGQRGTLTQEGDDLEAESPATLAYLLSQEAAEGNAGLERDVGKPPQCGRLPGARPARNEDP
jgi:hypothetical protein